MIAIIAAMAHSLNGDAQSAAKWAAEVRERNPTLTRDGFFRSFPVSTDPLRSRMSQALVSVGL